MALTFPRVLQKTRGRQGKTIAQLWGGSSGPGGESPAPGGGGGTVVTNLVLTDNGDGTFTATWTDAPGGGVHTITVDGVEVGSVAEGVETFTGPFDPDPLTAGTASATEGDSLVDLTATAPTGGVTPYSYQWYRSTTSGVKGSAISGATGLTYTNTGLTNGTAYYFTLTVTDAGSNTVDYAQVACTPATYGSAAANLVDVNFEIAETNTPFSRTFPGSTGYVYDPWEDTSRITVVADPTGSGQGNVGRIKYNPAGGGLDINRGFGYQRDLAYGEEMWFLGKLYFDSFETLGTDIGKLLYWQGGAYAIPVLRGNGVANTGTLELECGRPSSATFENNLGVLNAGQWYTLEMYVKMNTLDGNGDGVCSFWLNGNRVFHRTDVTFKATGQPMNNYIVGDQYQITASGVTQYRYWSVIKFGNLGRIAP